ncbi:MAG: asparagine synthase (glutamine-hydrolyzing) [Gammaproteobacteria bacterium]|nr:asparagine synthase (glutamine-hydrolyzing) [Gammaproteobacteria bacterium]MCP5135986.1 asparagine synthase (glutamine-hydrolyzing) [Gammaproteobacteria bacterium]
MCGIAGIVRFDGGTIDEHVLTNMRDSMVHRGPDGAGSWVSADGRIGLAHRRLSIIDLDQAAAQPMANEDGSVQVVFNGEIYNHRALRQQLLVAGHVFRTDHSDTEVIVHGYEEWGIDGLANRLHGMFGIAIWDEHRRRLFLLRDRVGIKPVYFTLAGGGVLFGSEIKALLQHPAVERDISPAAMYHYLSFLTTPAPMTMFKGIWKLPAGHLLEIEVDRSKFNARKWWEAASGRGIDPSEVSRLSEQAREEFYIRGIRERLERAVEKRMMSDVPFGAFLSGGVDSSVNVALMDKYLGGRVSTFTVGFSDHTHLNELEHAERVAKLFNTDHHEVMIDESDMVGYLEELIHHQDEPIADWVCIPLYFVSKLARDAGVKVVQVGEGSDEQFSGYNSYMGYQRLYSRYWRPFQKYVPGPIRRLAANIAEGAATLHPKAEMYADIIDRAARDREVFWSGATFFWENMKRSLLNFDAFPVERIPRELEESGLLPEGYLRQDSYEVIRSFRDRIDEVAPKSDFLTRMIYNEFRLRLPELLLMRVDKISMSVSLEARVPFLDHELVEFTMDIPQKYKIRNGVPKYLLKKAVGGWIPEDIIHRKKQGFGAPMAEWLKGAFGNRVEAQLLQSPLMSRGYFRTDYIRQLFSQHRSGKRDASGLIWVLFNLTAWYEYWVCG